MPDDSPQRTLRSAAALRLDRQVSSTLRDRLPEVAAKTVTAVVAEVPSYAGALSGRMRTNIEAAVQTALGTFLRLATSRRGTDAGSGLGPAIEAAYSLGRGEARSGRSMDALLAAYRVGGRVSWRELSGAAVAAGVPSGTMAEFAELVFAYIDELSAASVAGHADQLATSRRARERHLERLCDALLAAASGEALTTAAEQADWPPPRTLTAVLLPSAHQRAALSALDQRTLRPREDLPGVDREDEIALLLVPDADGPRRRRLLRALRDRHAVVGPARPWTQAAASYRRALRAHRLGLAAGGRSAAVDTDVHLAELLVAADGEALGDLRRRVLAPLAEQRPATALRLAETLRSWLLHLGRREDVAADLHVHPQTVRYRMGQLRELYGDRLSDPRTVLELTIAFAVPPDESTFADAMSP